MNFLATKFSEKEDFIEFFAAIFAAVLRTTWFGACTTYNMALGLSSGNRETAPLITGLVEVTGLNGERQVTLFLILSVIALVTNAQVCLFMYAFNAWQAGHFAN